MIERKHIAAIKVAQNDAGLDDGEYRKLLREIGGVSSCKDLHPGDVPDLLKAINARIERQPGWQSKQIRKFKQYCKFAGMSANESRVFLCENVGFFHETSAGLSQGHFDRAMAAIEAELESRIAHGQVKEPAKINISYWRNRKPGRGKVNTRERHLIRELWGKLSGYLPGNKRTDFYLCGLAAKASNRGLSSLDDLSSSDSLKVIEALKYRLEAEKNKLAKEVPF